MPKVAIVAALEREVSTLTGSCRCVEQEHEGRRFVFFERDEMVVVCGGIGLDAARRASEAVIELYHPARLQSVGFAGALDAKLRVGDLLAPSVVIDARDGSRAQIEGGDQQSSLVSFMAVAGVQQKASLAQAYGAKAVDMEAAAVAAAARAHGIEFGATKVISDESTFEMPGMDRFIDPHGRFKTASFAVFAALRPWLWSRVATLAGNSRKAAGVLAEHMERFRQELRRTTSQASGQALEKIAAPAATARPAQQAAATTTSGARGRE
jgi:adenosylhomocysteine nucleosidase